MATTAAAEPYRVFFGNVHNHSNVSDGKGRPEQAYDHARFVAGLDFFGLSDHAERISTAEWQTVKRVAESRNRDGVFVTFWGFEWSHFTHGHVTVIQTDDYTSAGRRDTNTFAELVAWVAANDAVAFFNHPGRQDKTGTEFGHFRTAPCPNFVGIDLFNKVNGFEVYYYNDGYRRNDRGRGFFDEALQLGWRVGAAGSDDNHQGTWGSRTDFRMAVLAEAKTRSAIYRALVARRFYATLDKNLRLFFEIGGSPMGSVIEAGKRQCRIRAADDDREVFEQIALVKNGTFSRVWHPYDEAPAASVRLDARAGDIYYVKVTQADGDEAISSPIWIADPAAPAAKPLPLRPVGMPPLR